MESLLRFRHLLTPQGMVHDHAVVVDAAGRISRLEKTSGPWDGYLALPGMPNAHSHVFQRAMSGFGEARQGSNDSFWSWRETMYRLSLAITPEQMYTIARFTYLEMLRAGYTSVAEFHYLHHLPDGTRGNEMASAVVDAANEVGIRIRLLPVYYARGGFDQQPGPGQRRFVHENLEDYFGYLESLSDVELGIAPHSLRAVPAVEIQELLEGASSIAGADCPVHIHIAEQQAEQEQCLAATGKTPIQLLTENTELSARWQLVHATHANNDELRLVAESGAGVVICPVTEAYLGDGLCDVVGFRQSGGRLAIGTDSNCRISVFEEMRMLEYGQRLRNQQRAQLADENGLGNTLWALLALGGAAANGFLGGAIATGYDADLVVIDETAAERRGMGPATLMDALVINGEALDISDVYVAGKQLVRGGDQALRESATREFASVVKNLLGEV